VNSAYLDAAGKSNLSDNYSRIDLGATVKILKNLNFRADYTIGRDNLLRHESGGPVTAWDFWTAGTLTLTNIATAGQDFTTYTTGRALVNTFNGYFTWQPNIVQDHHIKLIAGINSESDENINFFASRQGLLDPGQPELGLTPGTQTDGPSTSGVPPGWSTKGHGKKAFAGYFGRLNYDYKDKYLLEVNGRYDGSNYFPQADRWAFFGSASAGYRISEETFMQRLKPALSDLKVRASYGELGNQDVNSDGSNVYLPIMNGIPSAWVNSTGTIAQSVSQPGAIAPSLKWERVGTLDFGVDARFLNNHIGLSFDWYQRDTKGMIQNTSVPFTFGTSGPSINAGNFRSRGYELSIDANYTIGKDIQLYGSLGFSDAKTVFTKWSNPSLSLATDQNYVGKTYGEIWGFVTDGYFATDAEAAAANQTGLKSGNFVFGAGDVRYKDIGGGPDGKPDGKITGGSVTLTDHGDLKKIGNNQPRYLYNMRLGGSWKGWDLDVFIQGVGKRDWWGTGQTVLPLWQSIDILYANQMDFWTPEHTNAKYPRPYPGNGTGTVAGLYKGGNNFYPQTKYLLNMAYCRVKNITLGYALTNKMLTKAGITKLRFYLSGQNLATISHVGVPIDPEITDGFTSSGVSFTGRTYPFDRSYSLGLQLTF